MCACMHAVVDVDVRERWRGGVTGKLAVQIAMCACVSAVVIVNVRDIRKNGICHK